MIMRISYQYRYKYFIYSTKVVGMVIILTEEKFGNSISPPTFFQKQRNVDIFNNKIYYIVYIYLKKYYMLLIINYYIIIKCICN